jgi:hypothetical protein
MNIYAGGPRRVPSTPSDSPPELPALSGAVIALPEGVCGDDPSTKKEESSEEEDIQENGSQG